MDYRYLFIFAFIMLLTNIQATSVNIIYPNTTIIEKDMVNITYVINGFTGPANCNIEGSDGFKLTQTTTTTNSFELNILKKGSYDISISCTDGINIATINKTYKYELHDIGFIFAILSTLIVISIISAYLFINLSKSETVYGLSWLFFFLILTSILISINIIMVSFKFINNELTTSEVILIFSDNMVFLPYVILIIMVYYFAILLYRLYLVFFKKKEW